MTDTRASLWEHRPLQEWRAAWHIPELVAYQCVGSTNDIARARALDGADAGTTIIAEQQTGGRGRLGRTWVAPAGSSILMSVVMRPAPSRDAAPGTLPVRVGAAVARTITSQTGVDARLKWPNDVVVPERGKIAGILCEAVSAGSDAGFVIVGIGVNVHQQHDDWPPALRSTATSIDLCAGTRTWRSALAGALIDVLRPLWHAPLEPLTPSELATLDAIDSLRGAAVSIDTGQDVSYAVANGLSDDGALLVTHPDGRSTRITSATVRRAASSARAGVS